MDALYCLQVSVNSPLSSLISVMRTGMSLKSSCTSLLMITLCVTVTISPGSRCIPCIAVLKVIVTGQRRIISRYNLPRRNACDCEVTPIKLTSLDTIFPRPIGAGSWSCKSSTIADVEVQSSTGSIYFIQSLLGASVEERAL